jgi:hypothetical protein
VGHPYEGVERIYCELIHCNIISLLSLVFLHHFGGLLNPIVDIELLFAEGILCSFFQDCDKFTVNSFNHHWRANAKLRRD